MTQAKGSLWKACACRCSPAPSSHNSPPSNQLHSLTALAHSRASHAAPPPLPPPLGPCCCFAGTTCNKHAPAHRPLHPSTHARTHRATSAACSRRCGLLRSHSRKVRHAAAWLCCTYPPRPGGSGSALKLMPSARLDRSRYSSRAAGGRGSKQRAARVARRATEAEPSSCSRRCCRGCTEAGQQARTADSARLCTSCAPALPPAAWRACTRPSCARLEVPASPEVWLRCPGLLPAQHGQPAVLRHPARRTRLILGPPLVQHAARQGLVRPAVLQLLILPPQLVHVRGGHHHCPLEGAPATVQGEGGGGCVVPVAGRARARACERWPALALPWFTCHRDAAQRQGLERCVLPQSAHLQPPQHAAQCCSRRSVSRT